ncbi:hypothetical protein EJ04DRAFT_27313 [Polyplosphaeria fusca]|uniref:Uncharacterized protein n=1 Tax=Polyplosphaeria fusca TaxID=682080 RepID=A0A9P4R8F3_9PLEO|nr:hypothetical protein EJ04DRAFT_27313 [Polyplosphaeria fusca]
MTVELTFSAVAGALGASAVGASAALGSAARHVEVVEFGVWIWIGCVCVDFVSRCLLLVALSEWRGSERGLYPVFATNCLRPADAANVTKGTTISGPANRTKPARQTGGDDPVFGIHSADSRRLEPIYARMLRRVAGACPTELAQTRIKASRLASRLTGSSLGGMERCASGDG